MDRVNNHLVFDALVTDGAQRVALEVTRCLGIKGLKVLVVEKKGTKSSCLAGMSKYCTEIQLVDNYQTSDFFSLCMMAKTIFPVSTNTIVSILENASPEILLKCLVPPIETFRSANDKFCVMKLAKEVKIYYPETHILSPQNPPTKKDIKLPSVLKLQDDEGLFLEPNQRYRIVLTPDELKKAWEQLSVYQKKIVVQEYIVGPVFGWSAVYGKDGNLIAGIGHQRLREYPLSGGPSTYCISVQIKDLEEAGRKILDYLNWRGPAMVEFKRDNKDNKFKILEINPRYWGSLPLARFAGLNLPFLHYQAIASDRKEAFPIPPSYRVGVKLKFKAMDLLAVIQEIKQSQHKVKSFAKYAFECLNPSIKDGIFSWSDPIPGIFYIIDRMRQILKR